MRKLYIIIFTICLLFFGSESYSSPRLFDKGEVSDDDISEFYKWTKALEKIEREMKKPRKECNKNNKKFYCNIKEWLSFLDSIKDKERLEQIKLINKFANKKKYIVDPVNWGVEDYWESTGEFLLKNGDCEDYAIIKYISLERLGFSDNDMRIVIVNDQNLGVLHAILAVYHDDTIKILDNQISRVIDQSSIYHYSPIYSINKSKWWKYI